LRYFRFCREEFAVLEMLDGTSPLEELRDRFERLFPPRRMTTARLQDFLSQLYRSSLLLSDDAGQAVLLLERNVQQRQDRRKQFWSNLLAIRFRGFDPDELLDWLQAKTNWCFSPLFLAACAVLMATAALLLLVHAAEFRAKLPTSANFMSASNLLWLAATLSVIKVLHELGHAMTCKHFGGECHEMGVMLLLFAPCLYCNVTDSWMLCDRWQRVAISAAGILVECFLAALAVFGWWITQPGLLQSLCVNVILVCTVGTIVFNANPLMRYDGYFILSDLWGKPNLWQESRTAVRRMFAERVFGIDADARLVQDGRETPMIIYGLSSMAYQLAVVGAAILFLYRALEPKGLGLLAHLLGVGVVAGATATWIPALARYGSNPTFWRQASPLRMAAAAGMFLALAFAFLYMPFPSSVRAPALAYAEGAEHIYVSTPGTLVRTVSAGTTVRVGQELAQLTDFHLESDVRRLSSERGRSRTRVANLEVRAAVDADAASELVVAREMCADIERQLHARRKDKEGLTLKASIDGQVIPPPSIWDRSEGDQMLPSWTGTPLESSNLQCFLERGMLLCLVGNPRRQEAIVFVDETDVQLIRPGQRVRIRFDSGPTAFLDGKVVEVAEGDVHFVPPELIAEKDLASRTVASGNRRPIRTTYQVRVTLDKSGDLSILPGARGTAKIAVEPQTLGERFYRAARNALTIDI
jgi:putative peptide zinc metalloprotease protein